MPERDLSPAEQQFFQNQKQCKKQCLSLKTKCSKPRKTRVIEKTALLPFSWTGSWAMADFFGQVPCWPGPSKYQEVAQI